MRLPQLEEMFGPPRSFPREGKLLPTVMTSLIPQLGQLLGVAFALEDGTDDQRGKIGRTILRIQSTARYSTG